MTTDRLFCPRCAMKHLAQARALLLEQRKGYPEHVWYAAGHLAEAEDEIVTRMPDEANAIRDERVKLETDAKHFPDFGKLLAMVAVNSGLEDEQICE
jgi:uncharacterized C2H2 Zn-finger protein